MKFKMNLPALTDRITGLLFKDCLAWALLAWRRFVRRDIRLSGEGSFRLRIPFVKQREVA